jgi:hypothetical protein
MRDLTPSRMVAVSKSDTVNENDYGTLWIEGAGDIKYTTAGGDDVGPIAIPSGGYYLDVTVKRVWVTGTDATGIYILFNS